MRHVILFAFVLLSLAIATASHAQTSDAESDVVLTFLSHRSGYNQIYASQPDGGNPRPFFGGPIADIPSFADSYTMFREPHWTRQSPNGKYFASWVYELGKPYSQYQGALRPMLCVGDIEGTWMRIVSPDCHEEFAWSPDSKQLAFSVFSSHYYRGSLQNRPDATEICISGIDGSNAACVLEQNGKWIVLDWSPDGERILIEHRKFGQRLEDTTSALFEFRVSDAIEARKSGLFVPDWAATAARKFLDPIELDLNGLQFSGARYSPTRNEIAIETFNPKNMHAPNLVPDEDDELGRGRMMRLLGKIHVYNFDAKELRKVADYEDGIRGPICWSPSGNELFFSRYLPKDDEREKMRQDKEHGLAIWAIGRDGKDARFVTTGWSPDFPHKQLVKGK